MQDVIDDWLMFRSMKQTHSSLSRSLSCIRKKKMSSPYPINSFFCLSNKRYQVHDHGLPLGVGSYATVYEAEKVIMSNTAVVSWSPDEPALVAKVTHLGTQKRHDSFHTERRVFSLLKREAQYPDHIIRCLDRYTINNHGVLILERFKGVTLQEHLACKGPLSESDTVHCLRQMVSALKFLHGKNIALRDLKAENIAYDASTRTCTLFDFGLSSIIVAPGTVLQDGKGTPVYMPPEMLRGKFHDPIRSDYWALGQLVFQMVTGRAMFGFCRDLDDLRSHVYQCEYFKGIDDYLNEADVSLGMKEVVLGLCAYRPERRWDLKQVEEWMNEEFGGDVETETSSNNGCDL